MTYKLDHLAFRKDVKSNKIDGFDRDLQLEMCARQLESLRATVPERWACLGTKQALPTGQTELKLFVKDLIRKSSESADFFATVDFTTRNAYEILEAQRSPGKLGLRKHLKNWDKLSHEHMVPGSVIYDTLIKYPYAPLFPVLEPLSYRALVSGSKRKKRNPTDKSTDVQRVDDKFSSSLPPLSAIRELKLFNRRTLPLKFWGLLRYDAAGLLEDLIPISERAVRSLDEYKLFKAGKLPTSNALDTLERLEAEAD